MESDCKEPLRTGRIGASNGCAGRHFGAAKRHNHKTYDNKSKKYAKIRN